jgi:hypothetical protein
MEIVSLESGRTTWLFPVEEILPLGGADGPNIVAAIAGRYRFTHPPANPTREDIEKNGLKFLGGQMTRDGGIANIIEFTVFNDGLVSVSTSTERAEAFLQDIYEFLVSEYAFRKISSNVKKVNLSTVVIDFESSLNGLIRDYKTDLIARHLNSIDGSDYPVELARMDFVLNKDPEFRPPNVPRFTIEKRANTAFSQHRYYSSAPIQTAKHLEILELSAAYAKANARDLLTCRAHP